MKSGNNKYSQLNSLGSSQIKSPIFTEKNSSSIGGCDSDRLLTSSLKNGASDAGSEASMSARSEDETNAVILKHRILSPQKILSILYFCNQRLTIFIAPVLISQGFPESQIGIIICTSGMIGMLAQVKCHLIIQNHPYVTCLIFRLPRGRL